jgi:hypothetical protein
MGSYGASPEKVRQMISIDFEALEAKALAAITDKERIDFLYTALNDLISHMDNILDPVGHEDIRLRKHPRPCCNLDWCVVHDMQRRVKRATGIRDIIRHERAPLLWPKEGSNESNNTDNQARPRSNGSEDRVGQPGYNCHLAPPALSRRRSTKSLARRISKRKRS